MNKIALALLVAIVASPAFAAEQVLIEGYQQGSGTPSADGKTNVEVGQPMNDGSYHTPQYMPGYPTAATIWPRTVEATCYPHNGVLFCNGYQWTPNMGRGEYLFYVPHMAPEPQVVEKLVPVPVPTPYKVEVQVPGPERKVYVEVPVKKPKE